MRPQLERWAEALAIEKLHGADAMKFLEKRICELALRGDMSGVTRFHDLAERLARLSPDGAMRH